MKEALIAELEKAERPSRELDAQIVASLNAAAVRPYPPSDDFGPKSKWQFWSLDGAHFLGNESKFPVPLYTSSIDAALTLVPEGMAWGVVSATKVSGDAGAVVDSGSKEFAGEHTTPAIALCIAALKARTP